MAKQLYYSDEITTLIKDQLLEEIENKLIGLNDDTDEEDLVHHINGCRIMAGRIIAALQKADEEDGKL